MTDIPVYRPVLVLVTGLQGTGKSTIADAAASAMTAPVVAHDWAMSGLRPFPAMQSALDSTDPPGHRDVGWSILRALARSQLRRSCSVVLDGVARQPEIEDCRALAHEEEAQLVVVETTCSDRDLHRHRVETRTREIPNWYELDWDHVTHAIAGWEPLKGVDLVLDAAQPLETNLRALQTLLSSILSSS